MRIRVLLACLLASTEASARTWHVNADGTGDAPTIAAAVDSAVSDDTIELGCGTYHEGVIALKGGLHLTSATGQVDCAAIHAELYASDTIVPITLAGLTLGPFLSGRAVLAYGNSPLVLDGCHVRGGMIVQDSPDESLTMRDCRVSDAVFGVQLVFDAAGGSARVERCTFEYLSGMSVSGPATGTVSIRDSQFLRTDLTCTGVQVDVTACTFSGDETARSFWCRPGTVARVDSCTFTDNRMNDSGGAIRCESSELTLRASRFLGNASTGSGGAVFLTSSPFRIANCRFSGNLAAAEGGAVFAQGLVTAVIDSCVFTGNSCGTRGGAVSLADAASPTFTSCTFGDNASAFAAGALNCPDYSFAHLEKCIVWGNCAPNAPGIYGGDVTVSCCDVEGGWPGTGVFDADPAFCVEAPCSGAPHSDGAYTLRSNSPCLPGGNACGVLIGARRELCLGTAVAADSWARVKAKYR